MDYIIDKERLDKVFSIFLERTFRDIRIDYRSHLVDGDSEDNNFLGSIEYSNYYNDTVLRIPKWSRLIKPLLNMFGDMWEQLILNYVSILFDYKLSKVVIDG